MNFKLIVSNKVFTASNKLMQIKAALNPKCFAICSSINILPTLEISCDVVEKGFIEQPCSLMANYCHNIKNDF